MDNFVKWFNPLKDKIVIIKNKKESRLDDSITCYGKHHYGDHENPAVELPAPARLTV